MRGFSAATAPATRARRWDVIVLGGALPGLVAAARLGRRGLRVLVVEEEAAVRTPACVREPFLLPGGHSVLDACLKELAVPLIDRRRLSPEPLAYQVVFPDARVNVGSPALTAEELVSWELADASAARELVRGLERAGQAELAALLEHPIVRSSGLRSLVRGGARAPGLARGLPAEAAHPAASLAPFLYAQIRALSNLGASSPPPEARARLLGSGLGGAVAFSRAEDSLRGLVRRRFESVHGEFRSVERAFEFVSVGNQPGLSIEDSGEVWVGRAIVLNAPDAALARFLEENGKGAPEFLRAPDASRCRVVVRFRAPQGVIPDAMARRVIHVEAKGATAGQPDVTRLGVFPAPVRGDFVDLVASTAVPLERASRKALVANLARISERLMPFSESKLALQTDPVARWDNDAALADPEATAGWPGEVEMRIASRPPIYRLPREGVAALGAEGDLLLGWRGGDAISRELA